MQSLIRGAVMMALALAVAWGFMERSAAGKYRSLAATNAEVANTNARIGRQYQADLQYALKQNKALIADHNAAVLNLFNASEANRKAADSRALVLLDRAAVLRNVQLKRIPYANVCETRLENIDQYLSGYIQEVRDASRP